MPVCGSSEPRNADVFTGEVKSSGTVCDGLLTYFARFARLRPPVLEIEALSGVDFGFGLALRLRELLGVGLGFGLSLRLPV